MCVFTCQNDKATVMMTFFLLIYFFINKKYINRKNIEYVKQNIIDLFYVEYNYRLSSLDVTTNNLFKSSSILYVIESITRAEWIYLK